ncbi:hypothetical protein AAMO2058_000888300 [Amorphochlora amoebiformis]
MIAICVILAAFGSDAVRTSGVVAVQSPQLLDAQSDSEGLEISLNRSTSGIAMAMDQSDGAGLPVMLQGSLREDIASYIITMKDRRKLVTESFRSMGLEYEDSIFEAFGPDNVNMDDFRNSEECKQPCKTLTNGEIGCELSHVAILRDFISKKNYRYCMVFEDDARVNPVVRQFFTKSGWQTVMISLNGIFLTLDPAWEPVKIAVKTNPYCTVAYIVSRKGAELLLKEVKSKGLQAADRGLRRTEKFKQVTLEPRLFDQDKKDTSAIHPNNGMNIPQYKGTRSGLSCINSDLSDKIGHN